MKDNNIKLVSINELLNEHFFIPNYQRGYRWSCQQVKDLLNDIYEFSKKKHQDYEFYCVQPLVVKEMSDEEKNANNLQVSDKWFEVIDGQQRLTTIYLVLQYLQDAIDILGLPKQMYELEYQRKTKDFDGSEFLKSIAQVNETNNSHIDYYHMSVAYMTIKEWFCNNKVNKGDFCNVLLKHELDNNEHSQDKANNVRFIWYESVEEDPIKVFTRLNIGKISLTNAELIKALFLNRSNFRTENHAYLKLRQQEIASEWDKIEYTLQDDDFWLFLHEKGYNRPTRIDFIFDLICEHNSLKLAEEQLESIGSDDFRTFRYFYEYFRSNQASLVECWKLVKKYYKVFEEWFKDLELYHYIGYLILTAKTLKIGERDDITLMPTLQALVKKWDDSADKHSYLLFLKGMIRNIISTCPPLDFQYKEDGSDKSKCRPILLFHNIQTVINQNRSQQANEKYQSGQFYKFPFNLFKLEGWDVEHINSNTTNQEDNVDTQKEWLLNAYVSAAPSVQESIGRYFDAADEEKDTLFNEIRNQLPKSDDWTQQEKNRIWNYALLDSSTNRSYGNAIFSSKRRIIIGKDKGKKLAIPRLTRDKKLQLGEETVATSSFVPPCTKQIFMKYYSVSLGEANYWTKEPDAAAYLKDIEECVKLLDD